MGKRLFHVQFRKIGNDIRDLGWYFEARDITALEPEVQGFVDDHLGEDRNAEVTIEPLSMKGQINYGLLGDFTIEDAGPA